VNGERLYEIRCPVHGFIPFDEWERDIIAQPAFQRLRRIRQLAWTDQIYPGAMHTRFEHSLGVMHTATLLYDSIVRCSRDILGSELQYKEDGLKRHRVLIRLAALLHDVGHGPFSHAGEELMPSRREDSRRYKHEDYSAAIIRRHFRDVIDEHPVNTANFSLRSEDVALLVEGSAKAGVALFWREIIAGHVDADRMDYLLRDSHHIGVQYGCYDLQRLIHTMQAVPGQEGEGLRLGVSEGGGHAAEALIVARYLMFTQVYFHKTRVAFDHHLRNALKEILPGEHFPGPEGGSLDEYLAWDDWRVLGLLAAGKGGEHGRRLAQRAQFREIYHTPESPLAHDLESLDDMRDKLGDLLAAEESAITSWYNLSKGDLPVVSEGRRIVRPLSHYSSIVAKIEPIRQVLLYVRPEDQTKARAIVKRRVDKAHD